jgi:hypothetical protein
VRCSAASLPKEEEWEKMGGNRHAHYEKELGEGGFRPGVQQKGWGMGCEEAGTGSVTAEPSRRCLLSRAGDGEEGGPLGGKSWHVGRYGSADVDQPKMNSDIFHLFKHFQLT